MSKETNARLLRLLPDIQSQATHYVLTYRPDLDSAEAGQEAVLAFLERSRDPSFRELADDEAVHRAALDGFNASRRAAHKRQSESILDLRLASDDPGPETVVIVSELAERVQHIIAHLQPRYQVVARGLMAGAAKKDIMANLGILPQNFTHYRRGLQDAFEGRV